MFWLIFAHCIGDWPLQNDFMADNKGSRFIVMLAHCVIWTGCISVAMEYMGIGCWQKVIFLYIGHLVCDCWKVSTTYKKWWHVWVDQEWHMIQCLIVWYF